MSQELWKYCTKEQCHDFLLSLRLTGSLCHTDEKRVALLYGLSNHVDEHYHIRKLPKRGGGCRTICEPDPLLKYVQKQILCRVLSQFSPAPCACAYRKGMSLRDNALPHTGKEKVLKLDIRDFFGNITYSSIYQHVFPGTIFPPSVRTLLTSLCCYDSVLPQGAPTSPCISNLVMKPFDQYMENWCAKRSISYTRYCDDLTFSGSFDHVQVIRKVRSFLKRMGFELNTGKTRIITRGSRQEVTGLTVNDSPGVPRPYKRALRQEWHYIKKYGISSHLERTSGISSITLEAKKHYLIQLAGKAGYILQIDPQNLFFQEMRQEILQLIQETGWQDASQN